MHFGSRNDTEQTVLNTVSSPVDHPTQPPTQRPNQLKKSIAIRGQRKEPISSVAVDVCDDDDVKKLAVMAFTGPFFHLFCWLFANYAVNKCSHMHRPFFPWTQSREGSEAVCSLKCFLGLSSPLSGMRCCPVWSDGGHT